MVPLIEVILHLEDRHLSLRVILVDPLVKINISTQMLGLVLRGHILTWFVTASVTKVLSNSLLLSSSELTFSLLGTRSWIF